MKRHHLVVLSLGAALSLVAVLLLSVNAVAQPPALTQLVMILDGSDSISIEGWETVTEGLASAIENDLCIPHDGSVELTVIQFGYEDDTYDKTDLLYYAKVEISPTIIYNVGDAYALASEVREIPYGGGGPGVPGGDTPMAHGIRLAAQTVVNSPNFSASAKQAINLMTDGVPNVKHPSGNYDFISGHPEAKTDAQEARNYLLTTLAMTDDQDEFDAEAIFVDPGDPPETLWLRDTIVWPQPGSIWDGGDPTPGWVREFYSIQDYADSLCEKLFVIQQDDDYDFGDAPDGPYPSLLANDGARHLKVSENATRLGACLSVESDSRQVDNDTCDDGVEFQPDPYAPGAMGYFTVTVTGGNGGNFCAWFDWDQDGSWGDETPVCQFLGGDTSTPFSFMVPSGASVGTTWARFRLANESTFGPTGELTNGEVEDYPIQVGEPGPEDEFDFGDAPDPGYPSYLASNGARHDRTPGDIVLIHLGPQVDLENDSDQIDADAYDDGVVFLGSGDPGGPYALPFVAGTEGAVVVDVTGGPGTVCAWFDWNQDDSWTTGETAFCAPLPPGPHQITFTVPPGALLGTTYARFRLAESNTAPTGYVRNGEVEDYEVLVEGPPPPPPPPPPVGGMTEPLDRGRVLTFALAIVGGLMLTGAAVAVWRRRTSSV